jgi:hypothetical protein
MERTTFPPGEGPTVYRSELCDLFGGCEACPGMETAERCGVEDLDPQMPDLLHALVSSGRRSSLRGLPVFSPPPQPPPTEDTSNESGYA